MHKSTVKLLRWVVGVNFLSLVLVSCAQETELPPAIGSENKLPRSASAFRNSPDNFQFVVVGDRTGNHRPGVFSKAIDQINLLQPEFVMSVGDLIEGYTEDESRLAEEWDEIESMVNGLDMPFFYTVGNHDLGNEVMRRVWRERFGREYYHFIYKNVLFISLSTEDPPVKHSAEVTARRKMMEELWEKDPLGTQAMILERSRSRSGKTPVPSDTSISEAQVEYVAQALAENSTVRWTFIFMHKPAWIGNSEQFRRIESALEERPYTVIAGHIHYYDHVMRHGRDYIDMGTTGGVWLREGSGGSDHVMWVTMTDEGPIFANIALNGLTGKAGLDGK